MHTQQQQRGKPTLSPSPCTYILHAILRVVCVQVYSLAEQNRFYKKAAGYCLRAVAK